MIRNKDFKTWEEFKTKLVEILFPGEPFNRGRYLFRGQSDADWTLTPTFDRVFAKSGGLLKIEKKMLSYFKRSIEGFDIAQKAHESEHGLRALGQHYGLPTRLLDWTESPYIAAFFAYSSRDLWKFSDHRIAVWVLDTENPIWSGEFGVEVIDVPTFGNRRLRNQAGKFTLSKTLYGSLEEYVDKYFEGYPGAQSDADQALLKCLLPAQDYKKALADLDAMEIHHATVFPGIEGSAQMALFRTFVEFDFDAHLQT